MAESNALPPPTAADAPAPAAEPPRGQVAKAPASQPDEGIKLILEQILVAFILAFVFRAFVLEAFVIPTGSMATTLLGAHMRFVCPDCGWRFTVNYHTDATNAAPAYATNRTYGIRCPNCAYRLPRENRSDPDNDATAPPISYGDRILVLKHLFLVRRPERWDVIVFKNPSRSGNRAYERLPRWSTEPYQQNYIKRLIGLPGERVMLLDGDVYVTRVNKPDSELRPADFQIARKHEVAQSALWRIVYDDDHRPQGRARSYPVSAEPTSMPPLQDEPFQIPWRAQGAGWMLNDARQGGGFDFRGGSAAGSLRFDSEANSETFPLTDFLTYDITVVDQRLPSDRAPRADTFDRDFDPGYARAMGFRLNTVSDLCLSLFYQRHSGSGPLTLGLTKRGHAFTAQLRDGAVVVSGADADGASLFSRQETIPGDFRSPRRIDFINADYRIRLYVDGELVFESTDAEYSPDVAALVDAEHDRGFSEPKPDVHITAADQQASIRHVSLWRDVYYTARNQYGEFASAHASPAAFPLNVMRLGEDEYFPLGDNPFLSGDARTWLDPVSLAYEDLQVEPGRVPERFMLGKAFFVYWPASYRPGPGFPALVPNFGDMRFIR